MEPTFFIIITGDPIEGFSHYGPYMSRSDAISEAETRRFVDNWWVVPLEVLAE